MAPSEFELGAFPRPTNEEVLNAVPTGLTPGGNARSRRGNTAAKNGPREDAEKKIYSPDPNVDS